MNGRRWLLLVLLLAALVHAPSLGNDFALDDRLVARSRYDNGRPNAMVGELRGAADYFATPYWHGSERADTLYRPVTVWSYALVYAALGRHLGEREALPQHVVNVLLFVGTTWLVWLLLTRLGVVGGARVLGAVVFAVHAIHSEAVSSVTGRAELLACLCGLLFVLLLRHVHGRSRSSLGSAFAGAFALFVAVCSKESALAFVVLAPLLLWVADHRAAPASRMRLVRHVGVTAAVAVAPLALWFWLRALALATLPPDAGPSWIVNPMLEYPASQRVPTAVLLQGLAAWKLLWPWPLCCDYGVHTVARATSWFDLRVLASLLTFTAGGLLSWRWRREPLWWLAGAVFGGASLLTSNLLFPLGTQFAERLLFTPSVCVSVAVGAAAAQWRGRCRRAGGVVVGVWCLGSAVVAMQRATDWRDDSTLYAADVVTQPDSLFVRLNAAILAGERGDTELRRAHLQHAVRVAPDYARAWNDLGTTLQQQNDLAAAERAFRNGLLAARADARTDVPVLQTNLAFVLMQRGRAHAAAALDLLTRALPHNAAGITSRLLPAYALLCAAPGESLLAFLEAGRRQDAHVAWPALLAVELERAGRREAAAAVVRAAAPDASALWRELAQLASVPADVRAAAARVSSLPR